MPPSIWRRIPVLRGERGVLAGVRSRPLHHDDDIAISETRACCPPEASRGRAVASIHCREIEALRGIGHVSPCLSANVTRRAGAERGAGDVVRGESNAGAGGWAALVCLLAARCGHLPGHASALAGYQRAGAPTCRPRPCMSRHQ